MPCARPQAGSSAQIGGGISELASALVAVDDLGADEPGIAEHLARLGHPSGGKCRADRSGADRPSRVLEPRHDIDREALPGALRREKIGGARAIEAEMKIEADCDAGHGKPPDQNAGDEVVRGKTRQRLVEPQHDRAVEPGRGQEAELGALVREAEQRLVRAEDAAGMRLEGERRGRPAERPGARERCRDHGAVATMDAVEIADGDHGTIERAVRGGFPVDHGERISRLKAVGHGARSAE